MTELIVLVDEAGTEVGTAPKASVHHADTPLHLAFSCYVFDRQGRFLLTRRALSKLTWPGVWTNSCCGHPMPGESNERGAAPPAGLRAGPGADEVVELLPDFRYRAELDGVVENEICPVFGVRVSGEPTPAAHRGRAEQMAGLAGRAGGPDSPAVARGACCSCRRWPAIPASNGCAGRPDPPARLRSPAAPETSGARRDSGGQRGDQLVGGGVRVQPCRPRPGWPAR